GGEVGAELLQRLVLALGVGGGHPAGSPRPLEGLLQLVRRGALLGQHLTGGPALGGDADQQVLGGQVLVAEVAGAGLGVGDDGEQLAVGLGRGDRGPGDARQAGEDALGPGAHGRLVGFDRGEQVRDVLVVLPLEQREQQVGGGEVGVSLGHGAVAGGVDRVPAPVGQLGVHVSVLLLAVTLQRPSWLTRSTYINLSLFHSRPERGAHRASSRRARHHDRPQRGTPASSYGAGGRATRRTG